MVAMQHHAGFIILGPKTANRKIQVGVGTVSAVYGTGVIMKSLAVFACLLLICSFAEVKSRTTVELKPRIAELTPRTAELTPRTAEVKPRTVIAKPRVHGCPENTSQCVLWCQSLGRKTGSCIGAACRCMDFYSL
ncbi:hypothetical protein EB796_019526 [Bugula neritina]|uniref:Uncharacterized protein n=1 Tax=Bugula neritina TaxID=10212 RepID=A0A7J7J7N2_BUGNE|nr:hypothetical protein EB796_019526 [Bugula neritina]